MIVTGKALVGYSWIEAIQNYRRLEWWDCEPFMAVIVGQVVKQLGTYSPGHNGRSNWYGDDDPEGPSLTVTGTVALWIVRQGLRNREWHVRDEQVKPLPEGVTYKPSIRAADRPQLLTHHCPMEEHHERQLALAEANKPRLNITDQRQTLLCLPRPQ